MHHILPGQYHLLKQTSGEHRSSPGTHCVSSFPFDVLLPSHEQTGSNLSQPASLQPQPLDILCTPCCISHLAIAAESNLTQEPTRNDGMLPASPAGESLCGTSEVAPQTLQRSGREETSLSCGQFDPCRAFRVIVRRVIDPAAHGIAPHAPGNRRASTFPTTASSFVIPGSAMGTFR